MEKADLALVVGLLGLLASLRLDPTLLLVALISFLVGKSLS
jgi:hypothetical protein